MLYSVMQDSQTSASQAEDALAPLPSTQGGSALPMLVDTRPPTPPPPRLLKSGLRGLHLLIPLALWD